MESILVLIAIFLVFKYAKVGFNYLENRLQVALFFKILSKKFNDKISASSHLSLQSKNNFQGKNTEVLIESYKKEIDHFISKLNNGEYIKGDYEIEIISKECLKYIIKSENIPITLPNYGFGKWKNQAPKEIANLYERLLEIFKDHEKKINELNIKIRNSKKELDNALAKSRSSKISLPQGNNSTDYSDDLTFIEDISSILKPNPSKWSSWLKKVIAENNSILKIEELESEIKTKEFLLLNERIKQANQEFKQTYEHNEKILLEIKNVSQGYLNKDSKLLIKYFNDVMNSINLPSSLPREWEVFFDNESDILIIEHRLPNIFDTLPKKYSIDKKGIKKPKDLTKKELQEIAPLIHPAIILRIAFEIFANDEASKINLVIVNGWVKHILPTNGQLAKSYVSTIALNKGAILNLNLEKINPLMAFENLKGKSAGKLIDLIPVTPIRTFNKEDKRFITTKDVLDSNSSNTNLALMDWQDFENLIAQLFQKEFGAEVKVTQASRDRGVDAVVFDPDPIKGGKYIIQAKRYTNTVDVSSVRDLCAVVRKEGASKGIMVTTSSYGSDAYAFAQGEPITLINGAELLALLEKNGYRFRINLEEARKILKATDK